MYQVTTSAPINPDDWFRSFYGDRLHYAYRDVPDHHKGLKAHCGRVMLLTAKSKEDDRWVSGLVPGRWYKVCSRCFAAVIGTPNTSLNRSIAWAARHWGIRNRLAWDVGQFNFWAIFTYQPRGYMGQGYDPADMEPVLEFVIERFSR